MPKPKKPHNEKNHKLRFIAHLLRNIFYGICFIIIALLVGMYGYHITEGLSWIDLFVSASMILSGMGPVSQLTSFNGKLFAGCYALFSGLVFIAIIALVFAPIIHQIFHKIHLESAE